jgi:hypothetical protein
MSAEIEVIDEMEESRISILKSLRTSVEIIKRECDEILSKIEKEGISANYSIGASLKSNCAKATKHCMELYYLKKWRSKIEKHKKKQKKKGKKDAVGN